MKKEIWRDIPDYEGLYQVSSLGRIKSILRLTPSTNGKTKYSKKLLQKILRGRIASGYLMICLCKNGKAKNYLSHRIVAKVFIPNPKNKPIVNHKKGIKLDNRGI